MPVSYDARPTLLSAPTHDSASAALSALPALAFLETHPSPTFVLLLSASALRATTAADAAGDSLPEALWTNGAGVLHECLGDDGRRAVRGQLLALVAQLEQPAAQGSDDTLGGTTGRPVPSSTASQGQPGPGSTPKTKPVVVRGPGTTVYSSVVAPLLRPASTPDAPSFFGSGAGTRRRSSAELASANTPTPARQLAHAALVAASSSSRAEHQPFLAVLQLHPLPEAGARTPADDGDQLPSITAMHAMEKESARRSLSDSAPPKFPSYAFSTTRPARPNAADATLRSVTIDPASRSTPSPPPIATVQAEPTLTLEEKSARRKEKADMKGAIARLLADEARSPLSKAEQTASFKTTLSVVLNTETESALWWGPNHIAFYNNKYSEMLGSRHPSLLGKSVREGWHELADVLGPTFDRTLAEGTSLHRFQETFFLERGDPTLRYPEEVFHTWSLIPVEDENGKNVGILNRSWETTKGCLAERRLLTLRDLALKTASCSTVDDFARAVTTSLDSNPHDVPFVAVYVSDTTTPTPGGPNLSINTRLSLKGSLGVPPGHPSMPPVLSVAFHQPPTSTRGSVPSRDSFFSGGTATSALTSVSASRVWSSAITSQDRRSSTRTRESVQDCESDVGSTSARSIGGRSAVSVRSVDGPTLWPIAQALLQNENVLIADCADLVRGFESRSFGELPDRALVMPADTDGEHGNARRVVIILGLNTRRPFDDDYRAWLDLIRLSVASGLSAVVNQESQSLRAEELARLDRAKTQFFTNVSHELATPISLISGPIKDLLLRQKEDSTEKQLLAITHRNVQRLGRLVSTLMDVSRVEAGRMQGLFSPRQLGRVTADLTSLFRSAIEKAGLVLTVEWDEDERRCAYIDSDLWEKICFNLIGNALKYTLEGGIKVFVRYGAAEVEFGVEDSGVGIPSEDISRVVERFHRVASTARSHEGTGVGLSLAADLIALHGGQLEVTSKTAAESKDGSHGSLFLVRLPLGSAHLPADRVDETAGAEPLGTSKFTQSILEEATTWVDDIDMDLATRKAWSGSRNGRSEPGRADSSESTPTDASVTLFWSKSDTVMIVDDNSDMRRYLRSILDPFVTVVEAKDGQVALDAAQKAPPDLILTDSMMPNLDGPSLVKAIREHPSDLALVPIILITARAGEQEKVEGLTSGAEDFLPKPFSSLELVARCHLQLQLGKKRIDLERRFADRTLELKIRAIEAEAKRKEADEQRRQQELLVDVTSHELRNPVSAILQNAQLVGENLRFLSSELQTALKSPAGFQPTTSLLSMIDEDIESCEAILQMAQSQERIANDVLSLARIQLSTLEIFPVPVDLIAETKRICGVFASECRLKQIQLTLVHGESLKSLHALGFQRVLADAGRLAQVLVNLISNAIRFTSPAPVRNITVSIEVRKNAPDDDTCVPPPASIARSADCGASISGCGDGDGDGDEAEHELYIYGSVADSGPGLTQEELSRLFKKFKQATPETHVVFGGSGLGLYVCRKICDLHDGKIEVVSDGHAAGSTFRFYFKAALGPIVVADDVSVSKSPEPEASAPAQPPSSPLSDGLVLIVEDNLINQRVLMRQLLKARIRADVASDGAEGLAKIGAAARAGTPYAAILLDIEMPVMDGLTAIRALRVLEAAGELAPSRTPVFALTGNARQGQIDAALAAGMDDVILKPYKIDDLLSKLRAVF